MGVDAERCDNGEAAHVDFCSEGSGVQMLLYIYI